jgi:cytochrome c-type biogenesis protein CcmH
MFRYLALVLLLAWPAFAVEPDEVLADPALELRARDIGQMLRCPVCQGENIDESNAEVAKDLRVLVRERLVAGDENWEVITYVTDRYGEYVLFEPEAKGVNLILYWLGPVALVLAMLGAFGFIRGRRNTASPKALTPEEQARIDEILRE